MTSVLTTQLQSTAATVSPPIPGDGWPAARIFEAGSTGLSLDEVVFLPSVSSSSAVNLTPARLTRNIPLQIPVVAGPSSDVCEESMAIALALIGGIGIIHRHNSIEDQAALVRKVKQFESGFILNPSTLGLRNTVADAMRIQEETGCSGIPITDNGKMGGRLMGLVTKRDVEGITNRMTPLSSIMTKEVVHVREPVTLREASELMAETKVAKLPVINSDRELVALICRGDIKRSVRHPLASRDANKQLLVGAALSIEDSNAWERAEALVEAGVDILCLETDGVNEETVNFLKRLKESFAGVDVIAGNVQSARQAIALCDAGADAIRVGDVVGCEATSIYEVARRLRMGYGIPVMADIGVKDAGQLLKAFCLGAATVTLDALLKNCEEAPGDHIYRDGVRVKLSRSPYNGLRPIELGLSGAVVDKGSAKTFIPFILGAVSAGFKELGLKSLSDISKALESGSLRLERQRPTVSDHGPKLLPVQTASVHCSWG